MADMSMAPAEGLLLAESLRRSGLSQRKAAALAGITEGRWRQIVTGFQGVGGVRAPVTGPADTLARMALAVGVDADDLANAGRPDAADVLRSLPPLGSAPSVLDRLVKVRDDLDALIAEVRRSGASRSPEK